jgi:hypothetical protein
MVEKELSTRVEVNTTLETRACALTKLPYPDIQLCSLAEPLCCCNVSARAFERREVAVKLRARVDIGATSPTKLAPSEMQ